MASSTSNATSFLGLSSNSVTLSSLVMIDTLLVFVLKPTPDSFKIQGQTTKMVVAKKFLNRFQIPVEDKRYEFEYEDGMLIVQLYII